MQSFKHRKHKHTFKKKKIQNTGKATKELKWSCTRELMLPEEAGYLEADESEGEETFRISQKDIAAAVDITSATKVYDLNLREFGPYKMDYYRDGRFLLLGGRRGHVAAMDWVTKKLLTEINVMESIQDVKWLHMPTMFAAAQKEWVYIYDTKGIELHCIKKLNRVLKMELLPYHFILATSSDKGYISWLDISIGKMVTDVYTKAGRLDVFCQNPQNAILVTGHPNGTVQMWSPNSTEPVVKMLCHHNPVRAVSVHKQGLYMATSGSDRSLKIWDLRTYKCLNSYQLGSSASHLDFSQRGLLATGMGNIVEIYKNWQANAEAPYIRSKVQGRVSCLSFCSFEDVLGVGRSCGFSSLLVPGSGEPNFDSYECGPFATKSQRREMEVKSLLEKIKPELIAVDQGILGQIQEPPPKKPPREMIFKNAMNTKKKSKQKSAAVLNAKKKVRDQRNRKYIKNALHNQQQQQKKKTEIFHQNALDRFKSNKL